MKQQPRPTISSAEFQEWREANPEPTPDLPALRKTLAAVDDDPRQWDQTQWGDFDQDQTGEWVCGTARCVAGWAATFAATLVIEQSRFGGGVNVSDTGAYALGLTSEEAWQLFEGTLVNEYGDETGVKQQRENIQIVAEEIAARARETL